MTASAVTRRLRDATTPFIASPELAADLQAVLTDLIELSLQSKQAHWNVVGPNFRDLHLQLDELVDLARVGSDTIAERMRALGAPPDGRSATAAGMNTLPAFPPGEQHTTIVARLVLGSAPAAVSTMRGIHDAVDAADPSTSDLLHELIAGLEKHTWVAIHASFWRSR
jgi:starvation-inducible DNA-binding protein